MNPSISLTRWMSYERQRKDNLYDKENSINSNIKGLSSWIHEENPNPSTLMTYANNLGMLNKMQLMWPS